MNSDNKTGRTRSLWPFYNKINEYEYVNPSRAYELIDEILPDLVSYFGPPDLWHNCAMTAARVGHRDGDLAFILGGLAQWPEDFDLLCDALQDYTSTHYDPAKAKAIWETLANMKERAAPYWRFWVYGATYHATVLHDPVTSLSLLDEGLYHVHRENLMNIVRAYRRILIDSMSFRDEEPNTSWRDDRDGLQLQKAYRRALDTLEKRYQLGIGMGVDEGYVLAVELATLYQERAGIHGDTPEAGDLPGQEPHANSFGARSLETAMAYLDLAERLYTGNLNHPIWDIYVVRIRVLMALRRYGEALNVMRSLPTAKQQQDPSIAVMMRFAALSIGQQLPEDNADQIPESMILRIQQQTIQSLFDDDGAQLEDVIRQNPRLAAVLINVLRRLRGDDDN